MKWTLTSAIKKDDEGVSPVVGTIMMVAVTVVLATTVVAVMNGFGSKSVEAPENLAFKAQAVDSSNNGASDRIKLTYVTGPKNVANAEVTIIVTNAAGTAIDPVAEKTTAWSAGDFLVYDPPAAGSYFVTISVRGSTITDQTIMIDE